LIQRACVGFRKAKTCIGLFITSWENYQKGEVGSKTPNLRKLHKNYLLLWPFIVEIKQFCE
jgi:hypothetical protein